MWTFTLALGTRLLIHPLFSRLYVTLHHKTTKKSPDMDF